MCRFGRGKIYRGGTVFFSLPNEKEERLDSIWILDIHVVQPVSGGVKIYLLCMSMCRRCLCVCVCARACVCLCVCVCVRICVVSVCCAHQQRHVKAEKAIDNSLKQGAMPPHDHTECEIKFP
jgi:hypothetical protein